MDYPIELEQWWVDQARAFTGVQDLAACLDQFKGAAGRLSDLFTVDRTAGFGDYARDERMLIAYGLFFFPQTYVRVRLVLSEWTRFRGLPAAADGPLRALDLGCGLGAASFALLRHLAEHRPNLRVELRASDTSGPSLAWMRRLFDANAALWPNATLETATENLAEPNSESRGPRDLVLACFTLNEVFGETDELRLQAWLQQRLGALTPSGTLILLEPAGRFTSVRMEQLRDWIAGKKLARILGPCLHHAPCPMLRRERDWCHEVRRWRVPQSVEYLNRPLQRSLNDLKFSFLLLGGPATEVTAGPADFRMIAPSYRTAGRITTAGCCADGHSHLYEMFTRGMNRTTLKECLAWERGDILRPPGDVRELADGKTLRIEPPERLFHPPATKQQ